MDRSALVPDKATNRRQPINRAYGLEPQQNRQPGAPPGPRTRAVLRREFGQGQQQGGEGMEQSRFMTGMEDSRIVPVVQPQQYSPLAYGSPQSPGRPPGAFTRAVVQRETDPGPQCSCPCHCPYCPRHGAPRPSAPGKGAPGKVTVAIQRGWAIAVPQRKEQPKMKKELESSSSSEEAAPRPKPVKRKDKDHRDKKPRK